jgi:16S rRNA (cytidine1402-2'-O)-methyltransferase
VGAPGTLYVIATPIGNRADLSPRARDTLASVQVIAAEDTRHTGQFLRQIDVRTPLISLHAHNEQERTPALLDRLAAGEDVAIVSDAGTPLIADPGYPLVAAARAAGARIVPIPGPCAAIAALCASGLPAERFCFEGFLPAQAQARRARLAQLKTELRTLVCYEAPHRVAATLTDLAEILGARRAVVARELSKLHETFYADTLPALAARAAEDPDLTRGELVLVVAGGEPAEAVAPAELERLLRALLAELPLSRAVEVAVQATGARRNVVYRAALKVQGAP